MRSILTSMFLLVILTPRAASAYKPVPWDPHVADVQFTGPLRVVREALAIDCRRVDHVPECALVARIDVENPTDAPATALAIVRGEDLESIAFDGGRAATEEEVPKGEAFNPPSGAAINIALGAKATATLVLRATMRGRGRFTGQDYEKVPIATRHPLLAPNPIGGGWLRGKYGPTSAPLTVTHRSEDGLVTDGFEIAKDGVDVVVEALPQPHPFGGPFVGVGSTTGSGAALRARVGWEAAPRPWLITGLSAEGDFRRRWLAAATFEAATSSWANVIPSVSLGAGVPFQFAPTTRAGVRFVSTLHWPIVGVAFTFDVYPSTAKEPIHSEFAVVVRAGL